MHRTRHHVAHLHLHHQGQCYQEYRKDVLDDDEHFAQHHLVTAAERALDHVDGLVARGRESREQPVDDAQDQDACDVSQDVAGRQHEGEPYAVVADAQHHLIRVTYRDQAVNHGGQQVCQQESCCEADGGEGH